MAIEVKAVQNYNNGYVRVEASSKNGYSQSYYLTSHNAKPFCVDLQKHAKRCNLNSAVALGSSAIVGVLGSSYFTKNKSRAIDITAKILSSVVLAGISGYFINDHNNKNYDKLLKKYSAREIQNINNPV